MQINITLLIAMAILMVIAGGLAYKLILIISVSFQIFLWFKILFITLELQTYLSIVGKDLVTSILAPYIIHLIIAINSYKRFSNSENPNDLFYSGKIRLKSSRIESMRIELDADLAEGKISKEEYTKRSSRLREMHSIASSGAIIERQNNE